MKTGRIQPLERKLNWSAINEEYGKKISDTSAQQELIKVMGEVVTLTKDQPTKIIDSTGQTLQYRRQQKCRTTTRLSLA